MTVTAENLVHREVHYCVSFLVSTLANAYGTAVPGEPGDLADMIEQAFELATPIDDWKEAASQHGLTLEVKADGYHVLKAPADSDMAHTLYETSEHAAIAYCDYHGLDPYQWEVFEHWIVSDWLANQLETEGEKVDKDFAGMTVWARTTTGQGIAMDSVIERITAKLNAA